MASELRDTGISVVGDVPWGTHLCHFYETKEDLLDILIPYFNAGLENNEFCVWVVSDPLGDEEAKNAFRQAVPEADRYLTTGHIEICSHSIFPSSRQPTSPAGRIEIVPHTDWYLKGGAFVAEQVIDGWNEKLTDALAKGYAGLRGNGNEAWLTEENRRDFIQYEKTLDEKLANQRMIVLCSYPLSSSSAAQIFDVVNTHQLAVIRRHGNWEVLETPEVKRAKQEIQRLNEELERRVIERTTELAAANEYLKTEIAERKRAEEALRASETKFRRLLDSSIIGVVFWDLNGSLLSANDLFLNMTGYSREDLQQGLLSWKDLTPPEYAHVDDRALAELQVAGTCVPFEKEYIRKDGSRVSVLIGSALLEGHDDKGSSFIMDITERKRSEEKLRITAEQLRALSARLQMAKEEESTRIAREIHDELGGALTTWKWDLEAISDVISEPLDSSQVAALQAKFEAMIELTTTTLDTVRRLASELRPMALDELGLVEAIEWQALQFQTRTGIAVEYECPQEKVDLNSEQSTAVFRILQETLTNVLRHAQATKVTITVKQESGEFFLAIKDNGRGIKESEKSGAHSLGLLGMRERAHLIGAQIDIIGREGKGTLVAMRIPISESSERQKKV
jgi:PAS domain S-box-containing protein